jgi:HAMP domain-containing protein
MVFCELHKKNVCFVNTVIGEIVQVNRCRFGEDRCYNELNLVNVAFLHRKNVYCHVPVDCIDVNKPLQYQCFLCDNSNLTRHFNKARLHLIECHPSECWPAWITPENIAKPKPQYITTLKRLLLNSYLSRGEYEYSKNGDLHFLRKQTGTENERFKVQLKKSNTDSREITAEIEEKIFKIEALKSELQQEKIFNAYLEKKVDKLRAKKTEIEQLKATIGHLTNELKNSKATNGIVIEKPSLTLKRTRAEIELEDKECKCSVIKILNADLEKKVDKLEKANTDIEMKKPEIEQLKATISHLANELKNAKATINIEFEDKECKCSVTKILNADLEKKVDKLKGQLELREKEIRALTEIKVELINSE